ncbi:MAG: hypothetical protein R2932_46085 [Caldilineaceae bacterium]
MPAFTLPKIYIDGHVGNSLPVCASAAAGTAQDIELITIPKKLRKDNNARRERTCWRLTSPSLSAG